MKNASFLPVVSLEAEFFISDLFGGERETVVRRISLPPRSSKEFDFSVVFDHIGTYEVGIRRVDVADPFGVFHHIKESNALHEVAVLPRVHAIAALDVSTEAQQEAKRPISSVISDGMDYCGVREYRWGDPIKSIHWKLSARTPSLEYYTRLYETNCNPGLTVAIDLDSLDYSADELMDVYDTVVESALSIEEWAASCGYETDIVFLDDTASRLSVEGPLLGSFEYVLERLPRVAVGDGRAMADLIRSTTASIYAKNNLIVCSACVTEGLVGELMGVQAGRRVKPSLVAVVPAHAQEDRTKPVFAAAGRLSAAHIDAFVVSGAADLKEVG